MYRNNEHYADPTFGEAYSHIREEERKARFRPVVYICSPYSGNVELNIANARRYCKFAVENKAVPIAPHLIFPQFMNDNDVSERETAMFMNKILISKCAELWVFGDCITTGMAEEIERAKQRDMTIRYFKDVLEEGEEI